MSKRQFKAVKDEAVRYIQSGRPIAAARVMQQYEAELSFGQYYEMADMVFKAINGEET